MSDTCYRTDELETLVSLEPEDPRRAHLDVCPRCRAQLALYREFMEPPAPPTGANVREADARLGRLIEEEIPGPAPDAAHNTVHDRITELVRRFRNRLNAPLWRPVMGLAASAAAVVLVITLWDRPGDDGEIILRGDASRGSEVVVEPAQPLADGRVRLSWHPIENADRYQIFIHGVDGRRIAELDAGSDTLLIVGVAEITGDIGSPVMAWRVVAFRGPAEISRSRAVGLELP